jgi:hypothetical protein
MLLVIIAVVLFVACEREYRSLSKLENKGY